MKIHVLLTGNEIMSGHIVDSNSAMMAEILALEGYMIDRKVTIGDKLDDLVNELQNMSASCDVLIVNGGLGPTIDDLTSKALSIVTSRPLVTNAKALQHLHNMAEHSNMVLNAANLKQTILPEGVDIIPNPVGTAVGFSMNYQNCLILCTPGVPSELRQMLTDTIVPAICQQFPNDSAISTLRFQTFGLGESSLQQIVTAECPDWPKEVELGFRAGMTLLEVKLTIYSPQHSAAQLQCYQRLKTLIGEYIVAENDCGLAETVIGLLAAKQQTLTLAESCTGGLIAASITEIAGASNVFQAGFVTYSNSIKQQLLGVTDAQLVNGAVSGDVVKAMAVGALAKSNADYAIAVSGIAGPDGGSDQKPVGTVWLAWGNRQHIHTKQLLFNASRIRFQQLVTATALDLLRRDLLGITAAPHYFSSRMAKS